MATSGLSPASPADARSAAADWYKDAVVYEIAVASFCDSNHDGVGDFPGLTQKLDYLQELGITCLWLMPFYPSPLRDGGYDIADFRGVHPALGTVADFTAFLAAAHARGFKVVADLVVNHTSDEHPWFQTARNAPPDSPLRAFYVWSNNDQKYAEAQRLTAQANQRAGWSWDPIARAYYWHRFFEFEPDLNFDSPLVRAELVKILRFWFDLGVDGLSLGGAAFLTEREGTRCEGLPETHAILKELRRALATDYPGRLLAAGVNHWPEDARAYFGDGAECQLVPHLPLAQRLFLALRHEERHPIVEMLAQTPAPPAAGQWLLLLRNHDELTLALATDEERDYMYREYAADPRMRRSTGICRRLAPLLENSRPRLELLIGLLFSLPGTPLLYYGDEIGMGDNVYLGDRTAVRTPMQWSGDRNGGFSQADFARLHAPPVMDPVYGFGAVNVEAQRRDPSSLFHWVRRLIGLRKRLRCLARGALTMLEPENRRILAFVRQQDDEVLLVVANLARSVQAVELDLAAFAGRSPVEAFGRSVLPLIGKTPYVLTLAPHAFHWFLLQTNPYDVAARLAPVPVNEVAALPTLSLSTGESIVEGRGRAQLEQTVLPAFLRAQRWFGGKARQLRSVTIADSVHSTVGTGEIDWLILAVTFAEGMTDHYLLPVGTAPGSAAADLFETQRQFLVARLTDGREERVLFDALADDAFCNLLLADISAGAKFASRHGTITAQPTTALAALRGNPHHPLPVVRGPATSSNSLVFYGRRLLLKLFRRLEPGINPDFEIGRFLTEKTDFRSAPRVGGVIEYHHQTGTMTLGILQALVLNQGDGWEQAVHELGRYYERASGRRRGPDALVREERSLLELSEADPPPIAVETIGTYLQAAALLGRRTAELHQALASSTADAAFAPEPLTAADFEALLADLQHYGAQAMTALKANLERLPAPLRGAGAQLLADGPALLERRRNEPPAGRGAAKIRCHGDYHLGQVLWVENDYILLDFEGEPTRTVEERRAKQSPLKDVAGMLRSFDYAAYAGLFAYAQSHPDDLEPLEPWARLWQQWVSAAFLRQYRATAAGAVFLPSDRHDLAALLDLFMLAKALYELVYELNNRPDWVRIPLEGIRGLLTRHAEIQMGGAS